MDKMYIKVLLNHDEINKKNCTYNIYINDELCFNRLSWTILYKRTSFNLMYKSCRVRKINKFEREIYIDLED